MARHVFTPEERKKAAEKNKHLWIEKSAEDKDAQIRRIVEARHKSNALTKAQKEFLKKQGIEVPEEFVKQFTITRS